MALLKDWSVMEMVSHIKEYGGSVLVFNVGNEDGVLKVIDILKITLFFSLCVLFLWSEKEWVER